MRLFAVCFVITGAALAASSDSHKLTLEDLLSAEAIGAAALSPDGKTFAITRGGQIDLLPSEGGWPVTLTSSTGGKSGLNWSPDSRYIAYASQGSIWTVPAGGGQPKRLTHAYPASGGDPREASDRGPQWSPKGGWGPKATAMQAAPVGRPTDPTFLTRNASRSTSDPPW